MATDFFTLCWKRQLPETAPALALWLGRAVALLLLLLASALVRAETVPVEIGDFMLERQEDGLFLSANLHFELPAVVEDVLNKGIPVFFVADAELRRDRWYWTDKRVAKTTRHMRLAFQPLLRRWRLQVAANPIGNNGLGVTLSQNFDSLSDALGAIQRFSRWRIADAADVEAGAQYNVQFQFSLDVSQLPRPFQIGALGQSEWTMTVSRNEKLVQEPAR